MEEHAQRVAHWRGPDLLDETSLRENTVPAPTNNKASAVPVEFESPKWAQVSGNFVNVRSGPGTEHLIVVTLRGGDYVHATGLQDGWLQIAWPSTAPAWISKRFVDENGMITGNRVRIRARGNLRAPILREAQKGERIEVIGSAGDWYKIKAPTQASAFISSKYTILGVRGPSPIDQPPVKETPEMVKAAPSVTVPENIESGKAPPQTELRPIAMPSPNTAPEIEDSNSAEFAFPFEAPKAKALVSNEPQQAEPTQKIQPEVTFAHSDIARQNAGDQTPTHAPENRETAILAQKILALAVQPAPPLAADRLENNIRDSVPAEDDQRATLTYHDGNQNLMQEQEKIPGTKGINANSGEANSLAATDNKASVQPESMPLTPAVEESASLPPQKPILAQKPEPVPAAPELPRWHKDKFGEILPPPKDVDDDWPKGTPFEAKATEKKTTKVEDKAIKEVRSSNPKNEKATSVRREGGVVQHVQTAYHVTEKAVVLSSQKVASGTVQTFDTVKDGVAGGVAKGADAVVTGSKKAGTFIGDNAQTGFQRTKEFFIGKPVE